MFGKYAWNVSLKNKKGVTIVNAFQSILNNSKRKPNKIWVDQGSECYSKSFKKMLEENNIKMYSTHNEEKSVVAEGFDIVDEYNNTYHRTIKIKPIDVRSDSFAEYNEESKAKDPKFKIGDRVRISKYKNILTKGYTPNWSEEVFVITKIKNAVPWTYIINGLNGEETVGIAYEKELQKKNQKEFRIDKILKTKGNKLYVKWKGNDNSFNI